MAKITNDANFIMLNILKLYTKLDTMCYICKKIYMEIVSARNFRSNQSAILTKALNGESVLLSSRLGMFKIIPATEEETLTSRICNGLLEVLEIEKGNIKAKSARDFLNEL